MTPELTPVERIAQARACVRQALDQWDATDLVRVEECLNLLRRSVGHLEDGMDRLRQESARPPSNVASSVAALRRDIARMVRVVDACSAFKRGLSLHSGVAAPCYDASGHAVEVIAAAASPGFEG
jgi:hypothetical protein